MTTQTEHQSMVNLFISLTLQPDADLSLAQILMMENHVRECAECAVMLRPTGYSLEDREAGVPPRAATVLSISEYTRRKLQREFRE